MVWFDIFLGTMLAYLCVPGGKKAYQKNGLRQ
jgi:hypothetical protein